MHFGILLQIRNKKNNILLPCWKIFANRLSSNICFAACMLIIAFCGKKKSNFKNKSNLNDKRAANVNLCSFNGMHWDVWAWAHVYSMDE